MLTFIFLFAGAIIVLGGIYIAVSSGRRKRQPINPSNVRQGRATGLD